MKTYVTDFEREMVLHFLANRFFRFHLDIGSIAFWGLPKRRGRRQSKKHPRALSIPNSDKSFKNLVAGM
jgi:hypothetical protein